MILEIVKYPDPVLERKTEPVTEFDDKLAEATGLPGPVFGAYADAEAKLRALARGLPHQRTLASIAVSAATEQDDETPLGMGAQC